MNRTGDASSCIYLLGPDGEAVIELAASRYEREDDFQTILANHPALIDGRQVDPDSPRRWLLVGREAVVPDEMGSRWSLDHLFVDQDGVATLVEVKRKSDTRLRREVVGQMLDYAANGSLRWTAVFLQEAFEATCVEASVDAEQRLGEFLEDPERVESFWETVESNLRSGRMRLLFVADEIPAELLRIVEFLNERMSPTEVLALELRHFSGGGYSTHIPRVLGRTVAAVMQKEASGHRTGARRAWDRDSFIADVQERLEGQQARGLIEFLVDCERHFQMVWGTGAQTGSFTPRRSEILARGPISVFSDGRVEIKPTWLDETPEARAWRDDARAKLAAMGWEQPMRGQVALVLRLPIEAWLPRARELLAAIVPG